MKYFKITLAIAALLTFPAFNACGRAEQAKTNKSIESQDNKENSIYISEEALDKKLNSDEKFYLIDVRETFEFADGHIRNAYNIPLGVIGTDITKRIPDIKKDDEIVLYCRTHNRSTRAYKILKSLGYTNLKATEGGWTGWSRYISGK